MHTLCNTHEAWFVTVDGRRTHTGTHLRTHSERPRGTLAAANHGWDGGGLTLWSFSISYAAFFFFFFFSKSSDSSLWNNDRAFLMGPAAWHRKEDASPKMPSGHVSINCLKVRWTCLSACVWGKPSHLSTSAPRPCLHQEIRDTVLSTTPSPGPSGGLMTPACPPHSYPDNFRCCCPGTTQGHLCP